MSNYANDKIGVGFYHLDPRWCSHNDFKWFMDRGMTNSYKLEISKGTTTDGIEFAKERGHQVWLGVEKFNVNNKSKETLSEYMQKLINYVNTLKERDLWDTVVGFHWDEPILGMTNKDFLNSSKAISEEFGKRIFPVFSGYETMGRKGNMSDPDGVTMLESFATKYITDYGFDSYGYDFRRPYNTALKGRLQSFSKDYALLDPNAKCETTEDYYRLAFKMLYERMENKNARAWVFPTTYTTYTWSGSNTDEDFCIAHIKGLKDILMEQPHPGGIYYYTFKTWRNSEPAMDLHLAKDNPERWNRFEEAAREILNELKDIKIDL